MRHQGGENDRDRDVRTDRPASALSVSSGSPWLRHLGFSAPFVVSLVLVLLVAGSFTVRRMVGGGGGGTGSGVGDGAAATGAATRAVPLGRTDVDVDRPIDPGLGAAGTATDELQRRGDIGAGDTLAPAGREGRLGPFVIVRTQQEHRGIPIFAADVVVTTEGERIVKIHGHPAPDIDLATTTPANDYRATLTLAETLLEHPVAPEDGGTLVIMPVDGGGYRLAWLGVMVVDRGLEQVALDAESGVVLHRVPVVRNVSTGET